jgi:RNA polymerase sigma-70 factor (ECF subfamily)
MGSEEIMTDCLNTRFGRSGGQNPDTISSSLLAGIKADRSVAWGRVVRLYTPLVYYWCRRQGLQAADAEDVVQEVLRTVVARIGDFKRHTAGDTFRGWLRTITKHKLGDHIRKQRQRPNHSSRAREFQDACAGPHIDEFDEERPHDVSWESRILYARVLELIQGEFEQTTWRAFLRVVVDGLPAADVATELQMSVNAVYLAKSRVLRRIRDHLGPPDV